MWLVFGLVVVVVVGVTQAAGEPSAPVAERVEVVRARVEESVADERRRADALAVLDAIKEARLAQIEKQRALAARLDDMLLSRTATAADFERFFAEGDAARTLAWENAVAQRERLRAHVLPAEWAKVFAGR